MKTALESQYLRINQREHPLELPGERPAENPKNPVSCWKKLCQAVLSFITTYLFCCCTHSKRSSSRPLDQHHVQPVDQQNTSAVLIGRSGDRTDLPAVNLEDFKVGPRNLPGEWKKVTDVYAQTDYTGNPPGDHQLARFHHGAQHHARTAMWSLVLLQMLRDQGVPEALSFDNKDINLIILACLFHDSGRQGDGEDNPVWERNSGLNCRRFMEQHRYEDADINICQRAIEYKSKQSRFPCNGDSRARLVLWVLHFADALDVIRVREAFDPRIPMRQCRGFPPNQAVDVLQAYSSLADVVHQVVIDQGDWINGGKFSWAIKESLEKADNPLVGQLLYLQVTQPDTFHQIESLVNALLIA